jgi:hypothetical protein
MTTTTPRQAVETLQAHPRLPEGDDERFTGYGVMGVPFAGGHYLALRDFVATSVGPAYRAIWHRDPAGRWTIHTTGAPELTCPRYFDSAAATARVTSIDVSWRDDHTLDVTLGDELRWRIALGETPATRMMTAMGAALPAAGWDSTAVLAAMGPMARTMLRGGRVRLHGATPNGPRFRTAPLQVWRLVDTVASWHGEDLGEPAPLESQARLGDFWLPQRGVFFVGRARFTPAVAPVGRTTDRTAGTIDRAGTSAGRMWR